MRIRSILMAVLATAALFSSCKKTEDLGAAKITVDPATLTFTQDGGSQDVNLTATRDWMLYSKPDWVGVSITEGKASASAQTVTISVLPNTENDRSGEVVFTIGLMKASVALTQPGAQGQVDEGNGTLERPYSVAALLAYMKANLGDNQESPGDIYVKGIISKVKTTFGDSGDYGNASFYIKDYDGAEEDFYVYQTYYMSHRKWVSGDTDVKVGDKVIICGPVVNYVGTSGNSTLETVGKGKSYIYSLNGVTDGTPPAVDYNNAPAKTVAEFISAADKNTYYKLTGTVSNFNAGYCSFDLTDASGSIYVYSVDNKDEWSSKIKNGATVTLAGKYTYYEKGQKHEVVNAYILSCEGGQDVDYNAAPAKTVAEFISAADTENYYKLTGTVSNFNASYCSFDLTDATGTIYVYSVANKADWTSKVKNGATVVLAGKYKKYNEKDEAIDCYILSCEGGQDVDYNAAPAKTVEEFIAAADADTYYKLTGSVSDFDAGNCRFNLTDASGTIYVYSVANKADWSGKIADGSTVTLAGKYKLYNNTPEVVEAMILSSEGGDVPPEVDGITLTFPDDNQSSNSVSSYADEWTAKKGSYSWTISCFNNNKWGNSWTYIKCGSKKADTVASIATDQALDQAIVKVVVTVDKVSEAGKINSTKLVVASDAAFTAVVEEVPVALSKAGAVEYPVSAPAAGLYYKLVYDCAQSSNNGIIQISKVVYATAE